MPARYAVFGQPIAHSLSPRIHAMFGAQHGIALDYHAIESGIADFPRRLAQFQHEGGCGANLTLPLKEHAHTLCATLSERAWRCGSVNTLSRVSAVWRGDSTDGAGLLRDLAERHGWEPRGARILLLGAGGAARAVAFAFADAGAAGIEIANRTSARAHALAQAIGAPARTHPGAGAPVDAPAAFDLIVNATAAGHAGATLDFPRHAIARRTLCYDLSYGHAAFAFIESARAAGAIRTSDGLGMLVEQAAESFALWHGIRPDTAPVYTELRAYLTARVAR
jgi:shikimate dehydrogenase